MYKYLIAFTGTESKYNTYIGNEVVTIDSEALTETDIEGIKWMIADKRNLLSVVILSITRLKE